MNTKNYVTVRKMDLEDISKIIELEKVAFPYMAAEGVYWKPKHLKEHINKFPEGQIVAEYKDMIVGSSSSLIITLNPEYKEHSWREVCGDSMFKNHDPKGDTLYGAEVLTHPDFRRLGIATKLYNARKDLAIKLGLKRIIAGGRIFNYCEHAESLTPIDYVKKVKRHEIREPVLSFQLRNGFRFIKILPNYIKDSRSLNYATFIEWKNPNFVDNDH
ncbi:hypothetical protein NKOR_07500 [Candidatus Nitrosopumilus koreensis AR1]|uniref:N-acetyltransferase domain-containing protein n=2 Tax=Nitrosopumilus TaxID=338191 RepID=K0BA88_9ARCH|nr:MULTISPECIES: GNAT family N-acetyltransferase [Nitrosopumilus]AFS81361.1 hypothetical protein NKOR_07500 [Candidatus Nitrosopumilus koreensis AR1]